MTNGMTEDLEDCTVAELAFWKIALMSDILALHDEAPALVYDLEERTARFGESIILFAKKTPHSPVNNRLTDQLVGAGTSVGANYCEADDGVSKPDFKHRIGTCRKEARSSKFFPRRVAVAEPGLKPEAREIWREAHARHRIFSRIWRNPKV